MENHQVERLLTHWAESFHAFSVAMGSPSSTDFLRLAWRFLLENQSEDSLRGCHVDAVSEQMIQRFKDARDLAETVATESLESLADAVETSWFPDDNSLGLVVFNPLGWEQSQLVTTRVPLPKIWLPYLQQRKKELVMTDERHAVVPMVITGHDMVNRSIVKPLRRPDFEAAHEYEILFRAEALPALGYRTFRLQLAPAGEATWQAYTAGAPISGHLPNEAGVQCGRDHLENRYVRVRVMPNGTLEVTNKLTGQVYSDWLLFEDEGDAGDTYTFSPPESQKTVTSLYARAEVIILEQTPLRSTLAVHVNLDIPAALTTDRSQRADRTVPLRIRTLVTLYEDTPHVAVKIHVDNTAQDHRLRVLFPTEVAGASAVMVGQPFGVHERPLRPNRISGVGGEENTAPTAPVQHFVNIAEHGRGVALFVGGLREYEVLPDGSNSLAVTMIRCVGFLNRNDLLLRRRPMAPAQFESEGAQNLGEHCFQLALRPHDGTLSASELLKEAYAFDVKPRVVMTGRHAGELLATHSFIKISPPNVVPSIVKVAEDGSGLVLRMYNPEPLPVRVTTHFSFPLADVQLVNLLEDPVRLPVRLQKERAIATWGCPERRRTSGQPFSLVLGCFCGRG
jgi:alpha-mannosidase